MNMATLFGKLREHELELGRLKEEEEIEEKKSIALKATGKKASKIVSSEDESDAELDNNELMSMVIGWRVVTESELISFHMENEMEASVDWKKWNGATLSSEGHIKPEYPDLKVKQRASRRFPQDKSRKQIKVKYDMLRDAFQEVHVEAMRLQYKVNRLISKRSDYDHKINNLAEENERLEKELNDALESVKKSNAETKCAKQDCQNYPILVEKIHYLTCTLAKFTQGKDNLDVLKASGRAVFRQGIGYKAQSNMTNTKKFVDIKRLEFLKDYIDGFPRNNFLLTNKDPNSNGYLHQKSKLCCRKANDVVAVQNSWMN
ncbi:hypothetical protein LR48_Vigan04g142700 [Vigna angularis]|uniref:Uncharacterized protein n=1 Tax=Phaseolus angularis TaxID=3914 RepID=A0A0L9UFB0_PHAAN|nr:hypothetical protein LR48_Vigan04g142700 [Vigna angularis]